MLFLTIVKVAFKSILANKLRSFLTMLGVIIGVGAVIAMLGLGAGTEEKVTEQVRSMGANLLVIRAGYKQGMGVQGNQQQNLRLEDADAVLKGVEDVNYASPEVGGNAQVKYFGRNRSYSVQGVTPAYFPARNVTVEKGRGLKDADVDRAARTCIIGSKVQEDLFEDANPLGETIKVKGINFVVVGVAKRKGEGWNSPDEQVIVPLSTAMSQVLGRAYLGSVALQIRSGASLDDAQESINKVMRRQHKIQPGKPDDYQIWNLQEFQDQMKSVGRMFTVLLAGVASISLLVGGIGIMNIMLVTVTERTREIGIRKALGARNSDVLTQFLLEAIVVSLTGGALGIMFGVGTIFGFNALMANTEAQFYAKFQVWPIIISFGFSFLVGVFFGWYPARKAASLDPIDALRYE